MNKNNLLASIEKNLYELFISPNSRWGISEWRYLLFENNKFDAKLAYQYFTWAAIIAPITWFILCLKSITNRFSSQSMVFFLTWSLAFMLIGILRIRFVALSSLSVALLLGFFASYLTITIQKIIIPRWKINSIFLGIALIILILSPSRSTLMNLPRVSHKLPMTDDLFSALKWMRSSTPATSFFNQPWFKPEYGVLASWDFGSWIEYIGHRPAIATPWGYETYGLIPQAKFFLSNSNDEADAILRDNQAKYVIISNTLGKLNDFSKILGVPHSNYYSEVQTTSGQIVDMINRRGSQLVSVRLFLNDGMPLTGVLLGETPPANLRLVYESPGTVDVFGTFKKISRIKIFERVPGAVLYGNAPAGKVIQIEIDLLSNRGRTFTWSTMEKTDMSGRFKVVVPYSTNAQNNPTIAISKYRVKSSSATYYANVSENDINKHTYILCE